MLPRLYVITDRKAAKAGCGDLIDACRAAADAGARFFQIRDKGTPAAGKYRLAEELVTLFAGYSATVLINDRADIATALGVDGVHRPQTGIPVLAIRRLVEYRTIGVSCHNVKELLEAEADGADFVTFGPVFEASSKPSVDPVGLQGLSAAAKLVDIPVYALGGVTPENAKSCLDAGAHGVAVLSGIMAAEDPSEATAAYFDALSPQR